MKLGHTFKKEKRKEKEALTLYETGHKNLVVSTNSHCENLVIMCCFLRGRLFAYRALATHPGHILHQNKRKLKKKEKEKGEGFPLDSHAQVRQDRKKTGA